MKTPDEIKKGMECCTRQENCDDCPYQVCNVHLRGYDEPMCINGLLTDVHEYIRKLEYRCEYFADWIHDMAMEEPRWISVKERLPEAHKNVLIHVTTPIGRWNTEIDCMDEQGWVFNADSEQYHITHWMPLPEPPKEE